MNPEVYMIKVIDRDCYFHSIHEGGVVLFCSEKQRFLACMFADKDEVKDVGKAVSSLSGFGCRIIELDMNEL